MFSHMISLGSGARLTYTYVASSPKYRSHSLTDSSEAWDMKSFLIC